MKKSRNINKSVQLRLNISKFILLGFSLVFLPQMSLAIENYTTQSISAKLPEKISADFSTYFSGQNKWLEKTINSNSQFTQKLIIKNHSSFEQEFKLEIKETTGPKEEIKILENDQFENIGSWIRLENERITIPANQSKSVGVEIKTPPNTAPSLYQAVILVSPINQNRVTDFAINTRLGNRIYLTIDNSLSFQSNIFSPLLNNWHFLAIICGMGLFILSLTSKPQLNHVAKK